MPLTLRDLLCFAAFGLVLGCTPEPRGDSGPAPTHSPTGSPAGTTVPTGTTTPSTDPRPNLLVVVIDDFGIDKLQAAQPTLTDLPRQPTLDALAADGVLFTQTWSAPLCSPTRASLLTGRHSHQLGIGQAISLTTPIELALGELTLAEALGEAGYATAAFGKWHLNSLTSEHSYDHPNLQGFGHYAGAPSNLNQQSYEAYIKVVDGSPSAHAVYATTDVADDAVGWLETAPEPWFGLVAFHAPHTPLHSPPDALLSEPLGAEPTELAQWNAMVEAVDRELGRVLDSIPADVRARTTIALIGDNGTLGNAITPPFNPFREKGTLFDGGIHVPLIVTGPAVTAPGTTHDAFVHVVDLFPTAIELAGIDPTTLGGGHRPGQSLVPLLVDPSATHPRTHLYADRFHDFDGPPWDAHQWTIRDRTHKLAGVDTAAGEVLLLYVYEPGAIDEGTEHLDPLPPDLEAVRDGLLAARDQLLADTPWDPQTGP